MYCCRLIDQVLKSGTFFQENTHLYVMSGAMEYYVGKSFPEVAPHTTASAIQKLGKKLMLVRIILTQSKPSLFLKITSVRRWIKPITILFLDLFVWHLLYRDSLYFTFSLRRSLFFFSLKVICFSFSRLPDASTRKHPRWNVSTDAALLGVRTRKTSALWSDLYCCWHAVWCLFLNP